jgi:uncharacterized membrane protein YphA (DoxX/SURF4 family)
MDTVLLIPTLVLAGVFLVAGLSKVADRPGSQQALMDLGVPALIAILLKIPMPLAELTGAATLMPSASAATVLA